MQQLERWLGLVQMYGFDLVVLYLVYLSPRLSCAVSLLTDMCLCVPVFY